MAAGGLVLLNGPLMPSLPTRLAWGVIAPWFGLAAQASAADCTKSRPEVVVAELYLRSGGLAQPKAQRLLSAPLRRLVAEASGAARADGAAWSGARATVGERLLVSDTLIEGPRASTRLSFSAAAAGAASAPEKVFVQLQLVREADGCWRVDDIVRDEVSLRSRLVSPPESPASR